MIVDNSLCLLIFITITSELRPLLVMAYENLKEILLPLAFYCHRGDRRRELLSIGYRLWRKFCPVTFGSVVLCVCVCVCVCDCVNVRPRARAHACVCVLLRMLLVVLAYIMLSIYL